MKGEENERHRIGMELHDNISQLLGSAKLYLGIANNAAHAEEALNTCVQILNSAITDVRNLSHKLAKPPFEKMNFCIAVGKLFDSFQSVTETSVYYDKELLQQLDLSDNIKLVVYRILQEQLNNIAKHAKANRVDVILEQHANQFTLSVTDDGIGFDPLLAAEGIGLGNMRNRIESLNGTLEITAAIGQGATLMIAVPT